MSTRSVLIGVLALVFGMAAAVMAGQLFQQQSPAKGETVPVVVATADIQRFSFISLDQIKVQEFPKSLVPPGAIGSVEDAAGRVAHVPFVKDEPLHSARLAGKGAGRGLAAIIPPGMQAVTIQTPNVAVGVAGFILPGNKVDVLFTTNAHHANSGPSTVTLLQNVEILAVDQRVEAPIENKVDPKELRSVTLLVTPGQAGRLALGQNNGTLHLALRNPEDELHAASKRITMEALGFPSEKVAKEQQSETGRVALAAPLEQPSPTPLAKDVPPPIIVVTPAPEPAKQITVPSLPEAAKPAPPAVIRTFRGTTEGTITIQPAEVGPQKNDP